MNSNLGLLMAGFALLFVYISVVLGNLNWIEQRVCILFFLLDIFFSLFEIFFSLFTSPLFFAASTGLNKGSEAFLKNFLRLMKKVFLSVAGMLVIGLALGASFGLCFYIGLSINDVCPVIPFLLLGIGDSFANLTHKCNDNFIHLILNYLYV